MPRIEFRDSFVALMSGSTRYDHYGTTARFASFRLATGRSNPEIRRLNEVRLCLIDPRAERHISAYCHLRLREDASAPSCAGTSNEVHRIREEIYTTLVALFDISDDVPTSVYLHTNLPYFRCEMFDGGMFLTYYLGGARFPETLEFPVSTRPYHVYKSAMLLARLFSIKAINFDRQKPSADLIKDDSALVALLTDLGCTSSLDELRGKRDGRFNDLAKELSAAGISRDRLF